MRLIDAEALKEPFDVAFFNDEDDYKKALRIIDNAPTINSSLNIDNITEEDIEKFKTIWQRANSKGLLVINEERPQGEWNEIQSGMLVCPFCGAMPHKLYKNYCAKCGADMRGEEE